MTPDESNRFENTNEIGSPTPGVPTQRRRSNTRKAILAATGAIVLIGLIGGLAYMLAKPASPEETPPANPAELEKSTEGRDTRSPAEHITRELETKMTGDKQQVDARTEQGGTGKADGIVYSNAAYQAGDQQFAVYPTEGYGFGTWSNEELAINDIATVESYLKDNNFVETPEGSGIFASKDVVCAIRLFNQDIGGFTGMGVGCADISDYETNYQAALPFFTAYKASEVELLPIDNLILASPTIKDGADGYKNAYASMGSSRPELTDNFVAFFYKAPEADSWTFFTGTQNDLSCDIFNTVELKKAFDGQRCVILGTAQESAVTSE